MDFFNNFDEYENDMETDKSCNKEILPSNDFSLSINKKRRKKKPILFNSKNAISQSFPFRSSLLQYILQNLSFNVEKKLQKCCKYFFIKNPTIICANLFAKNSYKLPLRFNEDTVFFGLPYFLHPPFSYSICVITSFKFQLGENIFALSQIISGNFIQTCNAKSVTIEGQNLSFEELKVLIGNENLKELKLSDVNIFDDGGEQVELRRILELIPNVNNLLLTKSSFPTFPSSTFESLGNFHFNDKINNLIINNIEYNERFDPSFLIQFFKNNLSPESFVEITLKSNLYYYEVSEGMHACKSEILNSIRSFFKGDEKPEVLIHLDYQLM